MKEAMSDRNRAPKVTILNNRKLIIHNNANASNGEIRSSWRSITRDVIIMVIPLLILYKISTHPVVMRLGNSPKQLSRGEKLEEMMRMLYLKRKRDEQEEKMRVLWELEEFHRVMSSKDVGEKEECSSIEDEFDNIHSSFGTIGDSQVRSTIKIRKQVKRKFIPAQKRPKPGSNNKRGKNQIKERRASLFSLSKASSTPSSPPWSSAITSAISDAFATGNNAANKGKETSGEGFKTNQATDKYAGKKKYKTDHKGVKQKISWKKHRR